MIPRLLALTLSERAAALAFIAMVAGPIALIGTFA